MCVHACERRERARESALLFLLVSAQFYARWNFEEGLKILLANERGFSERILKQYAEAQIKTSLLSDI